jgi:thioredoxin-like negative regulator of GroEL
MFFVFFFLSAITVSPASGFYKPGDGTVELTAADFNRTVLTSDRLWYVEFYVLRCGKCEVFAPEWIKIANALQNVAQFGVVNADAHAALGDAYGVEHYPAIRIFRANAKQSPPVTYEGEHTGQAIFNDVFSRLGFKV